MQLWRSGSWWRQLQKQLNFGREGGGAVWKLAKPVLVGKLEEQGSSVISSKPCYHVLTGTRVRIWVKGRVSKDLFPQFFPTVSNSNVSFCAGFNHQCYCCCFSLNSWRSLITLLSTVALSAYFFRNVWMSISMIL